MIRNQRSPMPAAPASADSELPHAAEFDELNRIFESKKYTSRLATWPECLEQLRFYNYPNYADNVPGWKAGKNACKTYMSANSVKYTHSLGSKSVRFIAMQAPEAKNYAVFTNLLVTFFIPLIITIVQDSEIEKYWDKANGETPYWIDGFASPKGDYSLQLSANGEGNDFYRSKLFVAKYKQMSSSPIQHLQIYAWEDDSALTDTYFKYLINLYAKVYKLKQNAKKVAVGIHCMAGIGRTGTLIAGYIIYEKYMMAKSSKKRFDFNVFEIVKSIRKKRYQAVRTHQQYEFIYQIGAKLSAM